MRAKNDVMKNHEQGDLFSHYQRHLHQRKKNGNFLLLHEHTHTSNDLLAFCASDDFVRNLYRNKSENLKYFSLTSNDFPVENGTVVHTN